MKLEAITGIIGHCLPPAKPLTEVDPYTMVVVDPVTFPARLEAAGFSEVQVDVMEPYAFRFRAKKSIAVASESNGVARIARASRSDFGEH